jgi:quercetin dioxygenase-like cupin family protein
VTESNDNLRERTRQHPAMRFAPAAQDFDLEAAADALARESTTTTQGHRQKTLYRYGGATLALFLFDPNSEMREHRANGTVFIQVLRGRLTVTAQGAPHPLSAGQVLVMSPGVPHDVRTADEPARMLLTVCLEPPAADQAQAK